MSIAYVQSDTNAADAAATSIAATFGSNVGTGQRLIIVGIAWDGDGITNNVSSITDTLGTSFALARFEPGVADLSGAVYYGLAPTGGGADTVTVNFSASVPFRALAITEVSGNATASVLGVVNSGTGNSTGPTSGAATTSQANDFVYGFVSLFADATIAPGTNEAFTEREDFGTPSTRSGSEDFVNPEADSVSAQFILGTAVTWVCLMATFKEEVGGGGGGGWFLPRPFISGSATPAVGGAGGLYFYLRRRRQGAPQP